MAARSPTSNLEHSMGEHTKSSAKHCSQPSVASANQDICQICQESLSTPRYLVCDHAFCGPPKDCLLTLITTVGSSGAICPKCPVCRADVFPDSQSRESFGSKITRRRSTGIVSSHFTVSNQQFAMKISVLSLKKFINTLK